MSQWKTKMIGATLGALAALSIGGATYAFAQTADDSTTTEGPAATAPATPDAGARNPEDCPDKAAGGGGGGGSTSDATSDDAAADAAGEV